MAQGDGNKRHEKVFDAKGRRVPHLFLEKESGIYVVRKKFGKRKISPLFKSTGEKVLSRARTAADVIIQRHVNFCLGIPDSHVFGQARTKTMGDVAHWILQNYTPDLRAGTQALHRYYFREIIRHFGDWDVSQMTPERFTEWVKRERRKGGRRTFFDFAKHLTLLMKVAYEQKFVSHLVRFKNPDPKQNHSWRVYTPDELTRLWEEMGDDLRDQFVLSCESFMRLREVLHLSWDRIDLDTGKITLRAENVKTGSKTGVGREFIMSPNALSRLRARRARMGDRSPFVFPSPADPTKPVWENRTAWRAAKENAGIKGKATWHSLRHTALTRALLDFKANPIQVSEYAGVRMTTIQRVYLHPKADQTREVANVLKITSGGRDVTPEKAQ